MKNPHQEREKKCNKVYSKLDLTNYEMINKDDRGGRRKVNCCIQKYLSSDSVEK